MPSAKTHFVLHVERGGGGFADREIAHRENIGQHDRRGDAGVEEGAQAVALLPRFGPGQVEAIGQLMLDAARGEALAEIRLQAIHALVEVELAFAHVAQRGRRQAAADLARVLRGLAVLAIYLPVEAVGEPGIDRIHFMGEGNARTGLVVFGDHRIVERAGEGLQSLRSEQVGVGIVLVAFHGQPETLVFARREHQLGQQAAAVAILRVGLGARAADTADFALVLGFLALPMADRDQSRPAVAAERGGRAAEQAVPAAVVAELEAKVGVLAFLQVIRRVLGDEGDGAAQRIGAIQRTGGAAHDFHALERVQVDEVAVGVGEAADGERIRYRDAIGLDAHAVTAQAADADVAQAETAEAAADGDAGFVAEQVLEVADQQFVHAFAFDHIDRVGHVGDGAFAARGGDLHAFEFIDGGAGIGGSFGVRAGGKRQPE